MPTTPKAKKDEAEVEAPAEAPAEAQAEAPAEESEAPPAQVEKDGETAYTPERLIEDAPGFLGVSPEIAAGALHGTEEEHLTVEEGKQAVEDFLKREVTTG